MIKCFFIAGHLIVSNGAESVPLDNVTMMKDSENSVYIQSHQNYMWAGKHRKENHIEALRMCAYEAETEVMAELGE